eukprot:s475_g13.t1
MDRDATVAVLKRYPDMKRWLLIREISGAFQTGDQKRHWVANESSECAFCQQEDSRTHRLMHCPVGADVRQPYQELLRDLLESESLLPEYPLVTKHPAVDVITCMHFSQSNPVWGQAVIDHVMSMFSEEADVHFFTDGSCMHPQHVGTRHAAFAVVLDLCRNNSERVVIANQYRRQSQTAPTFQTACVSRCQGEQDILRAEISAIVSVAETIGKGTIHVDSQIAISNSLRAIAAVSPRDFATCEHADLLFRLWQIRDRLQIRLEKVKSHQVSDIIEDALLRYWAMGNNHVDVVAQHACKHLQPDFVSHLQDVHSDITEDQRKLEAVFDLHIQLQEVRRNAAANLDRNPGTIQHDHKTTLSAYCNWKVDNSVFHIPALDMRLLEHSAFGEEIARMTAEWASLLVWPPDDQGPLGQKCGISWIELGLSWMLHHGRYTPVIRKDNLGTNRLYIPSGYEAAKQFGLSLTEVGTMIQKMITNCAGLIPEIFIPAGLVHGKCSSLYRLGACRYFQGVDRRPSFPCQMEVLNMLVNSAGVGRKDAMSITPQIIHHTVNEQVMPGTWQFRLQRASLAMKTARKRRKG